MQAPLPRRSKGPSAIAAAAAAIAAPGAGSEDDAEGASGTGPEAEATPGAAPSPMSTVAVSFVAELAVTPEHREATGSAEPAPRPRSGRRVPRAALPACAAVGLAALIGGILFAVDAGDTRQSASGTGAVPGITHGSGPYDSTSGPAGSAAASTSPSASPSAPRASASPKASVTGSAGAAATSAPAQPSATTAVGARRAGSGPGSTGTGTGTSCVTGAGSGAITDHSVCVSSGTVTFRADFHTSEPYYHVFINTDGDTATGYRLPYPSPSALGADYMIENGGLYRSRSTDWSWTEIAARPTMTVSGSTRTWTLSLNGIGSPAGTQKVEFNAGSDYTSVITFSPA